MMIGESIKSNPKWGFTTLHDLLAHSFAFARSQNTENANYV